MRMGTDGMPKKILLEKPGGYRKVGCLRLRWLDNVTDGMGNWGRRTQDRELWWKTIEEAKAHLWLLSC
jgi:hypothetical protein